MGAWTGWLASMNSIQISTFGQGAIYTSRTGLPPFPVDFINTDPLRKEEADLGNFEFGFINNADLAAAGCTPIKGDTLSFGGFNYRVEQVQVDAAEGVHLMLLKTQ